MYTSPFSNRYGSKTMRKIFSDNYKYSTWRKLWVALAEVEKDLGLNISDKQIKAMEANVNNINWYSAKEYEKETKHDVMAHILAYGEQCPKAKPIIHLGATSCFVTDNTDVIQQKYALLVVRHRLAEVLDCLCEFAEMSAKIPTLGYTHYQVAQPITIGKRICMWMQDLMMDLDEIEHQLRNLKMLGCKGATGTAASFLELFDGDEDKTEELERRIVNKFGFSSAFPISGQTYTRKQDYNVLQALSGIAQSASKFANDIRLLSNLGEVNEFHSKNQVGSSAMPYKSNPIQCERVNSLSRLVICNVQNCAITTATQWLERTLDDSANRRIVIPESFLAIDEVLITYRAVVKGLEVNLRAIKENWEKNFVRVITEPILMLAVKRGGDRQELHGKLKEKSMVVSSIEELKKTVTSDPDFRISDEDFIILSNRLTGLSKNQTINYTDLVRQRLHNFDLSKNYE